VENKQPSKWGNSGASTPGQKIFGEEENRGRWFGSLKGGGENFISEKYLAKSGGGRWIMKEKKTKFGGLLSKKKSWFFITPISKGTKFEGVSNGRKVVYGGGKIKKRVF